MDSIQPKARGLLPLKARLDVHQESKRAIVEFKTIRDMCRNAAPWWRRPPSTGNCACCRSLSTMRVTIETGLSPIPFQDEN
ncbi:MAG: hypothetical protein U1F70_12555 [Candidatus Competibacteraceae bacterium]